MRAPPAPRLVAAIRRLSLLAIILGLALVAVAAVWWASFFRPLGLDHALSCLYARGGGCGFIKYVAGEAGRVAYSPTIFRLGAGVLIGGGVARLAVVLLASAGAGRPGAAREVTHDA